jgi:hypothetical protein
MSKVQTLKITRSEALILEILLRDIIDKLEVEYQKNKKDKSFLKEEALSEINNLKGLLNKLII